MMPARAEPPKPRVLLADDDPIFASLVVSCIERAGFEIEIAADGALAFDALDRGDFDMVIVDLSMPRVDGFRLISMVRSTARTRHLPVLVMSSRGDFEAVEQAYAVGADGYQQKPVDWALLPLHIRHILASASAVQRLRDDKAALEAALQRRMHKPAA